jgi:acetylornithine/N-succinyldiaminopimelate aminotransferase
MEKHLIAEALASDPRVAKAKQLLLEAVEEHRQKITGILPPNPELKQKYQELLEAFSEYRGAKLWFPFIGSGIGNGSLVELMDGSIKYDFISGIGPHYWGHSHPNLVSTGVDAAISDTVMQGHLQQNSDSVEISKLLIHASNMDHCFLTTSGAMANENALKIAFQKRFPAHRVLAFEHCFAGRTTTLAQITDKPSFREGLPSNLFVDFIPFFDPLRPEESIQSSVAVLKQHLARHPKEYAVFLCELVQGEGGFYPGSKEFFTAIMAILKENHISIIADEIQTFARTPALFAYQYFEVADFVDIVTIGKLSQVCATIFRTDHRPRPGLLSQTFTSSTAAIHAAKAILHELMHDGYFGPEGKIMQIYNKFTDNLSKLAQKHPKLIHGPFGIGSMISFTPFDGEAQHTIKFVHALFEAGVMSFIAGSQPTRVRFLVPAGAVTMQDIDQVTKIIEQTLLNSASS